MIRSTTTSALTAGARRPMMNVMLTVNPNPVVRILSHTSNTSRAALPSSSTRIGRCCYSQNHSLPLFGRGHPVGVRQNARNGAMPSVVSRPLHGQQQHNTRSFYSEPNNFEHQFKPWEEIALDLTGWYVAFALIYPMVIRNDDDGSWRDGPIDGDDNNEHDDNTDTHNRKTSHSRNPQKQHKGKHAHHTTTDHEGDQRH